jgi:hypothetical protein
MREREHAHVRIAREPSDLGGRCMQRLVGPLLLLGREGRLVHEQVCSLGRREDDLRRPGVAREHELAARPRRAEHLSRLHLAPVSSHHGLAGLKAPEQGSFGNAERARRLDVEASRP